VWLSQAGNEYDNAKIVYLTPQFFGFDFGIQYAPNMGNRFSDSAGSSPYQPGVCTSAGANCIGLTSGNDATRWFNQVVVGGRYQGSFGGVDVKFMAAYGTAGKASIAGGGFTADGSAAQRALTTVAGFKYDNLSYYTAATAITFAGFTLAADYMGGAINGQLAMRPSGGASTNGVVTGVTYRNGPWVLGLEGAIVETQGDARLTKISQRHEWEVAAGGTYNVAPGLAFVAEYMYTARHQGGFDFVANGLGTTRDVKGQSFVLGTVVTW